MRPSYALTMLGLSLACSGCALVEDAARNTVVSIKAPIEAHRENARNRRWAESAWQKVCGTDASHRRSDDYADGFKEGYAEHLFRGGDGEPPIVAPLRYRHLRYQNAQGYQAIQDWFAGYRHGASVAHESGARRLITGPSALQTDSNDEPMIHEQPGSLGRPEALPSFPKLVEPEPAVEPARVKITNIHSAPVIAVDPVRARITKISEVPAATEPPRARITTIKAIPLDD